jgi:hypothetical protein
MGEAGRGWGNTFDVRRIAALSPMPVLVAHPPPNLPHKGEVPFSAFGMIEPGLRVRPATAQTKKAAVVSHGGLRAFNSALS